MSQTEALVFSHSQKIFRCLLGLSLLMLSAPLACVQKLPGDNSSASQGLDGTNPPILATGDDFSCYIKNQTLRCWGGNANFQLGTGESTNSVDPVTPLGLNTMVTAVAAGAQFACAIKSSQLYCWGANESGQLGLNDISSRSVPTYVSALGSGVTAVALGHSHACAIKDSRLFCWGANESGQLGLGNSTNYSSPQIVASLPGPITQAETGGWFSNAEPSLIQRHGTTCAIQDGALYCWGRNNIGQVGIDTPTIIQSPHLVGGMEDSVDAIDVGWNFACGKRLGKFYCWGNNWDGQLADPSLGASSLFATSVIESGVEIFGLFSLGGCAVLNKTLQCWGRTALGQTGTLPLDRDFQCGSTTQTLHSCAQTLPEPLKNSYAFGDYFRNVDAISRAHHHHMCFRDSGTVYCMGHNHVGQLGRITTPAYSEKPLMVQGL